MEELQVIETTSGRQFKPWASREDVQVIKQETVQAVVQAVQDPASVTAITSEIASGKQAIAAAINAKGGEASATESFSELAEAVEEIPNYSDMVKLAGIIAGGNYNKNALQGHNENVTYGKTEIIDNVGAFEKINIFYCFQYWDLLEHVDMPNLTTINSISCFRGCTALNSVNFPALTSFSSSGLFNSCSSLEEIYLPNVETYSGTSPFSYCTSLKRLLLPKLTIVLNQYCEQVSSLVEMSFGKLTSVNTGYIISQPNLRNITIGQDTDVSLPFSYWTATNVIAEGQSGINELNSNLYNNLLTKLYDHSQDGQTRTLRIGWLSRVTAENIAYANAKGWTLTT